MLFKGDCFGRVVRVTAGRLSCLCTVCCIIPCFILVSSLRHVYCYIRGSFLIG